MSGVGPWDMTGLGICPPFGGAGAFDEELLWYNEIPYACFMNGFQNGLFMGSEQQRQQYLMQMIAMGWMGPRRRGGRRFGRRRNDMLQQIWIEQAMGGGLGGFGGGGMGAIGMGGLGGMGGMGGMGGLGGMGGMGIGGGMRGIGMGGLGGMGGMGVGANGGLLMGSPFGFVQNPLALGM